MSGLLVTIGYLGL